MQTTTPAASDLSHASFAKRLSECADKAGGLGKLAKAANLHRNTLTRYLNGREPDRHTIIAIAQSANVSPEWLLTGRQENANSHSSGPFNWPTGEMNGYKERLSQIIKENGGEDMIASITGFPQEHIARLHAGGQLTAFETATLCSKLNVSADWLFFGRREERTAHGQSSTWPVGSKSEYKERLAQLIQKNGGDRGVSNITGFPEERITRMRETAQLTDFETATVCQKLNASTDWLFLGKKLPDNATTSNGSSDLTPINELRIFDQGATLNISIGDPEVFALSRNWTRASFRCEPEDLAHFKMPNAEMEPLIKQGASVIINRHDPRTTDGVYVFKLGDQLLVRKLEFVGPNADVICPTQQRQRPYQILDVQGNTDFHFFGKAIWWTFSSLYSNSIT